jgi:hypothetical protein
VLLDQDAWGVYQLDRAGGRGRAAVSGEFNVTFGSVCLIAVCNARDLTLSSYIKCMFVMSRSCKVIFPRNDHYTS